MTHARRKCAQALCVAVVFSCSGYDSITKPRDAEHVAPNGLPKPGSMSSQPPLAGPLSRNTAPTGIGTAFPFASDGARDLTVKAGTTAGPPTRVFWENTAT